MKHQQNHYIHLGLMIALSCVAMYVLIYAMTNVLADVFMNVNQVYMAGLMTAPMVIIELLVMRAMDDHTKLNTCSSLVVPGSAC
jgi:hypothetical protein